MSKRPWPRLSADLIGGERRPGVCQGCGATDRERGVQLVTWREHDENDQPEDVYLILCTGCSNKLIEPHPRLYDYLPDNQPRPGIMTLCADCRHRRALTCTSPRTRKNGGPGLDIEFPRPHTAFVDGRDRSGRRRGWVMTVYPGPATRCSGWEREPAKETADVSA